MSKSSIESECSICNVSLGTTEIKVKTECGHVFHRRCAQKRLDENDKSDCEICKKPLAIANVLGKHETTTTTTPLVSHGSKPVQHEKKTKNIHAAPNPTNENYHKNDGAKSWCCEKCSMKNKQSTKRCESCGARQHGELVVQSTTPTVDIRGDTDDEDSQSDEERQKYHESCSKGKGERRQSPKRHTERRDSSEEATPRAMTALATPISDAKKKSSKGTVSRALSQHDAIVYIPDLPINIDDNMQLELKIRHRIETVMKLKPGHIKCYPQLGVGIIQVDTDEIRNRFINDVGHMALDRFTLL